MDLRLSSVGVGVARHAALHAVMPCSGLSRFVSEQLWLYAVSKFTPDHMKVQWDPANTLLNPPLSPSQDAGAGAGQQSAHHRHHCTRHNPRPPPQPRSRSQSPVFAPTAPLPHNAFSNAFSHPNPHERPQYGEGVGAQDGWNGGDMAFLQRFSALPPPLQNPHPLNGHWMV